jgi:hypothetical protein
MANKALQITLPPFKLEKLLIHIVGTSPLIVHAFPEKARKEMLDKQMKVAKGGRDARNPVAEFEAAQYVLPDGRHGFPAVGFKAAAVTACTSLSDVTKVAARQAFRVKGEPMHAAGVLQDSFIRTALVPLVTKPPIMREDVARLSGVGRTPEMRYRPEYPVWGVELEVELNPQVISAAQLATMFRAAGHGVGIGDYRPERDGDCGTFDVVPPSEFEAWKEENDLV